MVQQVDKMASAAKLVLIVVATACSKLISAENLIAKFVAKKMLSAARCSRSQRSSMIAHVQASMSKRLRYPHGLPHGGNSQALEIG